MDRDDREEGKAENGRDDEAFACEYCGSETCADTVRAAFWRDKGLVAIEGIPARICEGCGEQFYDEATTRKIEKILENPTRKARRKVLIPVFSLEDA